MQTSATGRVNSPAHPAVRGSLPQTDVSISSMQLAKQACQQGFTLLEVLVVLVIISVIIGFAVLSVDTGPEKLRQEGTRLASLLELTSEQAVMNGREYRLVLHRRDYAFEMMQDGKWRKSEDELLRARQLPDGMTIELTLENQPQNLSDGDTGTATEPVALVLLSSGEISPFELTVADFGAGKVTLRCDGNTITTDPTP